MPDQLEKDIDVRTLPELSVFFPDHPIKAAMESYLTRGQGLEPAGKSCLVWFVENKNNWFKWMKITSQTGRLPMELKLY